MVLGTYTLTYTFENFLLRWPAIFSVHTPYYWLAGVVDTCQKHLGTAGDCPNAFPSFCLVKHEGCYRQNSAEVFQKSQIYILL